MTSETPDTRQETTMDPWMETARMYAQNADYWRARARRAERFSPSRAIRIIRSVLRRDRFVDWRDL